MLQTIEGHKFDSIAATYYLLRDTEYLPDYVELARMQKSGAQCTCSLSLWGCLSVCARGRLMRTIAHPL